MVLAPRHLRGVGGQVRAGNPMVDADLAATEQAREVMRKLIVAMGHLDATILQFDPEYEAASIRPRAFRPPKDWAKRGEMTRIVLDILRQAAEPMRTRDIAFELLTQRALDRDDKRLLRTMAKRVGVALREQRDKGVAVSDQGPGQYGLWRISR